MSDRQKFDMQSRNQPQAILAAILGLVLSLTAAAAAAQQHPPNTAIEHETIHYEPEVPHHLSFFLGGTRLNQGNHDEAFTYGVDYEYRVNKRLGVGVVMERAAGAIDATTFLLVTDIHLWKGLAIQTGPGIERVEGRSLTIGRIGLLYEFSQEKFTIAPMAHYDFGASESSFIVGIAFGRAF